MATLIEELHTYLFDGQPHILAEPVGAWLASSRRFVGFVSNARDKVRKKLRVTKNEEALYDLKLELETVYLLLREKSLSVAYEPEHSRQIRSPDFAVTFTTRITFMVEVTRLRSAQESGNSPVVAGDAERLTEAICSKLGQLLPQRSNILIIGMEDSVPTQPELNAAMLRLRQRAEQNDAALFKRFHLRDRGDFFSQYGRLSEVMVRSTKLQPGAPVVLWVNGQARHPLPGKVQTVLYRSHSVV